MDGNSLEDIINKPVKITDWKKEPKITDLKQILDDAKKPHQEWLTKVQDWRDLMEASGKYAPKKVKNRSAIQPKLIRRQAEWRYSALTEPFLGSEKMFQVNPATFEDIEGARQNELLLNWQFRTKINNVKFIDELVRAVVDEGTGVCRVGWNTQSVMDTEIVPIFEYYELTPTSEEDEEFMMLMEQLEQATVFSQQNPREFNETFPEELKAAVEYYLETGIPVRVEIIGEEEQEYEKVLVNQPVIEVLDPADVYLDPTCKGNMDNALFVIHAYEVSRHELMKDSGAYQNLDKIKWSEVGVDSDRIQNDIDFKFKDAMKSRVTVYEYWGFHDINDDGVMVPIVAAWIGDQLIRLEESPFPDGKLPFVVIPYLPVKRQLYGEPDAELLRDNQAITGAVMRAMVDLLGRSANAQTGTPVDFLDPINERRFDAGLDYRYNTTQGLHPRDVIHTHKLPEIPNSALDMLALQSQDAESLSGVKAFSSGISGAAYGQVAAGIRGALDATSKREMAILRRIAKGVTSIGNKIIAMNSEFLSETEVVRVTNRKFVEIRREDLKGNYDLVVDISTAEIDDAKSQDLAFMVQTIGPIAGPEAALKLVAEIADLKRMPDVAENLRNFKQEPSEQELMMQELQLKKAELEVAELESRIQTNMALAAKYASEADENNLNAEEQARGVKHKRDMEKQKAQSQGNQNLAITKELAKQANGNFENIEAAIGFTKLTELSGGNLNPEDDVDNQHSVKPVNNNESMGR